MAEPLGNERQLTFFQLGGHDHDGENSTPVKILPDSISLYMLNSALIKWLQNLHGGTTGSLDNNVFPVPDLNFDTPPIGPGGSHQGTLGWVGLSFVRFMRIIQSQDTECTITFYHKSTFADEDREFRAYRCGNKFMWEGTWGHYDEESLKQIYYKIENTGNQSSTFRVTLKSGTMAANAYARFIESIEVKGVQVTGPVQFLEGNGITLTMVGQTIQWDAVAPTTVYRRQWALTPTRPSTFTSSTSFNINILNNPNYNYTGFGSGLQWIQADMGSVMNLGAVDVVMYVNDGRVYHGVQVDVSADGINFITCKDSGDFWSQIMPLTVHFVNGFLARYIRVWSNGSTADSNNHIAAIVPKIITNKS